MELKEFSSLLACGSSNIAKNTLSYLIGNGESNDDWGKALANLYYEFPSSVKNKKEFLPIIIKYFKSYYITKDNIALFNEYEELFSAQNRDEIIKKNPKWQWEQAPEVIFKNALSFANAIPYRGESKFEFIKRYENQFTKFVEKDRTKIEKHFSSKNIWYGLIEENYFEFVQLCNKYQFNRIEILQEKLKYYNRIYSHNIFESDDINYYLDDLMKLGKQELKNIIKDFYPDNRWHTENNNSCDVFSVLMDAIQNHQYKSAMKWIFIFDEELIKYTKMYNVDNLYTSENFKKLLQERIKALNEGSYNYNSNSSKKFILERALENHEWFNFMDKFKLFEKLQEDLQKSEKTKDIKKLKI